MENVNNSINYIELPLREKSATIAFYEKAFGWVFTDWGPGYISFSGAGVEGGFNAEAEPSPSGQGVLVILYAMDLEKSEMAVKQAGGTIAKPAYGFPGGRRFHFLDPNGNELAIWSER